MTPAGNSYAYQVKKSKHANRGTDAEEIVQSTGDAWRAEAHGREFNRMVDSKAAGRVIKAAAADFDYFCQQGHGLIEVKETEHDFRLDRKRITQLARLRLRERTGGRCLVLVYHSTLGAWRGLTVQRMVGDAHPDGVKGSWDLRDEPVFGTAREALAHYLEAFA